MVRSQRSSWLLAFVELPPPAEPVTGVRAESSPVLIPKRLAAPHGAEETNANDAINNARFINPPLWADAGHAFSRVSDPLAISRTICDRFLILRGSPVPHGIRFAMPPRRC